MKLSLSVRVAESPKRKDLAMMPIEELAPLASASGFAGLSMRASVVSVNSSHDRVREVKRILDSEGLAVSMVTGDLGLAANDASATAAVRNIGPYLDLADALDCRLVRVMMQSDADIPYARRAADTAAERGMTLAHMTHWGTLIETADDALRTVEMVGRENFGVVYEPANMMACCDDFGAEAIRRMAPHLVNVMFQNARKDPGSPIAFRSNRRGHVALRYVALDDATALDARAMIETLQSIGYDGWITVHQPLRDGQTVADSVREASSVFAPLIG
jgi:sugar phosphate isomerase/epimerase